MGKLSEAGLAGLIGFMGLGESGIGVPSYKEEGRDSEVASTDAQTKSLWYKHSNPLTPLSGGKRIGFSVLWKECCQRKWHFR